MKAVLALLVALMTTGALAQTTGAGPYYATPSWDQKLQCDTQAACPRFIVLANWDSNAVLDRETGLVWERSPSTSNFNWQDAQTHCNALSTGNRIGWRFPTLQELASLVDRSQSFPPLPPGHPFTFHPINYWSATTSGADTSFAWVVDLFGFGFVSTQNKTFLNLAWCVRGGQGVDPQ
jgi:hypothetical protein